MTDIIQQGDPANINLIPALSVTAVHGKLSSEVVMITTDKLTLILTKHADSIQKKNSWIAPLGVFLSLILAILTAEFKDFGIKANVWSAVFIIAATMSFIWLIKEAVSAYKSQTIADLVIQIKDQAD